MRVLHLVKTSIGGHWALRQMRELVRLGAEIHVALPPGPLVRDYDAAGVEIHVAQFDLPVRAPWRLPQMARDLRALVGNIKPDIIHSHFVGTTLTMRLALGNFHPVPRVFQVPGPLHLEHQFFRSAEIASASELDYWVGTCEWTSEMYRRSGAPKDRVFLSYYGTDTEMFRSPPKGILRKELGIGPATKLVGMVAYMYSPKRYLGQTRGLKGHEDLIDAIALCRQRRSDVKCIIAGGEWGNGCEYERKLRQYAKNRCGDTVIFLGTRRDVPLLYPDFDVAVHPSHSENIGGAGESLGFGVPTVATNVGGFPDVVRPGETGWLVPPGSPVRLSGAILEALENRQEAEAMAVRGQRLVYDLLDIRITARQTLAIYESILAGRRGRKVVGHDA